MADYHRYDTGRQFLQRYGKHDKDMAGESWIDC